jgi:hypothetical protein
MSPDTPQYKSMAEQVKTTIERGGKIIVFGWESKNHDSFTRALEETDKVRFTKVVPISANSVDLWIFTRFVGHSQAHGAKNRGARVLTGRYEIREVKDFLKGIAYLVPDITQPSVVPPKSPKEAAPANNMEDVEKKRTRKTRSAIDNQVWHAIAIDFSKAVGDEPGGSLTRYELSPILARHLGSGPQSHASRYPDYFEPLRPEGGRKAGSYKATDKLLELITEPSEIEPTDPLEKARWLINRQEKLMEKRDEIKSRYAAIQNALDKELEAVERDIQRAADARGFLEKLRAL